MTEHTTSRPFRDLALAISLLTILPLRAEWPSDERPDIAGYFPAAGLLLGLAGWGALRAAALLREPAWPPCIPHSLLLACLLVALWAYLTRLLHWDGLADVADGLWGATTPSERIAIMSDSRIGAFGASAIVLVGLVQVSSMLVLIAEKAFVGVLLAPVIGRFAAVAGSWFGRPAKPTGLGAAVTGTPRFPSAAFALIVLSGVVAVSLSTGTVALLAALSGLLLAFGVPHLLASRFGGVTGDVLGAAVMITETATLVLFALVS